MGTLICACADASKNCDKRCLKGILIEPDICIRNPRWARVITKDIETQARYKRDRFIRRH